VSEKVKARMTAPGPKKILSCDGGGILGLMSVEILAKLEADLRVQLGKSDLVLGDWFDFVCGTSTGAMIAACISTGMSMNTIRSFYVSSGELMFDKASIFKRLHYKYNDEPLAAKLKFELNKALGYPIDSPMATLGDKGLRTLLMMVLRNHSTGSPWALCNNPDAKYSQQDRKDCNLNLPLWQIVRGSAAAPTFFPPEVVTFAPGTPNEYQFVFVDGGVTAYNNPAFLAFQMATAAPYQVSWKTGVDQLLLVSVGTGSAAKARPDLRASELWLIDHARNIPTALMDGASAGWDMACRMLGACRFGAPIDYEFGDMIQPVDSIDSNWTGAKQFTYVRYDPDVSQSGLDDLGLETIKAENIQVMDSVKYIMDIQRVGEAYAQKNVALKHLQPFVIN
jgi:patatin-like phospholipase/acyl hydrolase